MTRALLKQAAEALEAATRAMRHPTGTEWHGEVARQGLDACNPALAAIRAELAKPEPEPVGSVFTMEALVPGGRVVHHATLNRPLPAGTKLYTSPPSPEGWRRPNSVTVADAPAVLNLNDKAMWVIGWNECLAAAPAAPKEQNHAD